MAIYANLVKKYGADWAVSRVGLVLSVLWGMVMKENNEIKEELNEPALKVDKKRRSFAKAGISAPVIMTLASRPVFGAQCMSNMMSGNLSHPDRGECDFGNSPGGFKNIDGKTILGDDFTTAGDPVESTDTLSIPDVTVEWKQGSTTYTAVVTLVFTIKTTTVPYMWVGGFFKYGDLVTTEITETSITATSGGPLPPGNGQRYYVTGYDGVELDPRTGEAFNYTNPQETEFKVNNITTLGDGTDCKDFTGGSTFGDAFGIVDTKTMLHYLCDVIHTEDKFVCAMLNAYYYRTPARAYNYILKVQDVKDLYADYVAGTPPPSGIDWNDFLDSTWNYVTP